MPSSPSHPSHGSGGRRTAAVRTSPRLWHKTATVSSASEGWTKPWVQLRTYTFSPAVYPAMLKAASPDAQPGDLVAVYDKDGRHFGTGLYNPRARVPLRLLRHGPDPVTEDYLVQTLRRAAEFRTQVLQLDEHTDAYRVVSSDGDGLSGLTVDRYHDVLSVEVHSLGMHQRLPQWLPLLHSLIGTKREFVSVDDHVARLEGIHVRPAKTEPPRAVRIREHGVRFEIDFAQGHKTGFFCDQRDNRKRLAQLAQGRRLLDLCCYTGGFAVTAATLGAPADVTGVDLDEAAIAQARRNGNLNQQNRIHWVHADAFAYARQMQQNGQKWSAVVLDPPKFVESREQAPEGWRKYEDLNTLGLSLVEPDGLFVTCSCSGLVSLEEFEALVVRAAHRLSRRLQFFDRTGAGPDHPVMSNCPESRYLKVLWARVI
jgi:23S rRNA (cytosine1962-C5)-methyltransferase